MTIYLSCRSCAGLSDDLTFPLRIYLCAKSKNYRKKKKSRTQIISAVLTPHTLLSTATNIPIES